ncbi:WD-40 repeat-containing protein [Candidatus Magnetomorum sp. HK-1]|nr:WD-40 repeat-containing protein [Candidatus Magnetomorum sp. HK-1]
MPSGLKLTEYTIKLWDVHSGMLLDTFKGHSNIVYSVSFSPDGNKIVSGSYDDTIKVWDVHSGRLLDTFNGHSNTVYSVNFSPDGNKIVSGSSGDYKIKVWDVHSGKLIISLSNYHNNNVRSLSFSPSGKYLVCSLSNEKLILWDLVHLKQTSIFKAKYDATSVCFSPNEKYIFSTASDTIQQWDIQTGKCIKTYSEFKDDILSYWKKYKKLLLQRNDQTLYDVSRAIKEVCNNMQTSDYLKNVRHGEFLFHRLEHKCHNLKENNQDIIKSYIRDNYSGINSLCVSSTGHQIISGHDNNNAVIWEVERDGSPLLVLPGYYDNIFKKFEDLNKSLIRTLNRLNKFMQHSKNVKTDKYRFKEFIHSIGYFRREDINSVHINPTNKYIATGSNDRTIKIWDAKTGQCLKILKSDNSIKSVRFNPQKKFQIASATSDNIKIWNFSTGNCIKTLSGHKNTINSLSFSPDGNFLASGGDDHTVNLWDIQRNKLMKTFHGHIDDVNEVTFSPDGKWIASASDDGTIKIWNVYNEKHCYTIATLQDNEWIIWRKSDLHYNSSKKGDEHAAIRINNELSNYRPLKIFRKQYKGKKIFFAPFQQKPNILRQF